MAEMEKELVKIKDKSLNYLKYIAKSYLLKSSGRSRDRAKAEQLVKQIVVNEITNPLVYINALGFMCEFLIEELEMSNNLIDFM